MLRPMLIMIFVAIVCFAQIDGDAEYRTFQAWQKEDGHASLKWEDALQQYRQKLKARGLSEEIIERTLSIISSRDEATLYDPIFAKTPKFETQPNRLLMEAVKDRPIGSALDVGMGQGRNAVYLAKNGWKVTGFDVSGVGIEEAKKAAAAAGVSIDAVHASDEEFDFGTDRWDLIAIVYPIEKRSVYRVRQALKPGGIIVIECGLNRSGRASFEYESKELLKIFDGFQIVKYEEPIALHDWTRKEVPLVRFIAQKPR